MKNLKSNNRILSYLICFSLLAFVNISCETENELESFVENTKKEETTANTQEKKYRRMRRSMKTNINDCICTYYRVSVSIKNDNENEVNAISLEIEKKEGIIKENKTYLLKYYTTIKNRKYFTNPEIDFDGKDLNNQEITTNVTLLNSKNQPIEESIEQIIQVKGLSNANIKPSRTRMKQRPNGLYKMTAEIDNNEDNEVAEVAVSVSDLYGNTNSTNAKPKNNGTLLFLLNENGEIAIEGKIFRVNYTLTNLFGDVINTFKEEVTVESNIIKKPKLIVNKDGKTFSLNIPFKKNKLGQNYQKLKINATIKATNGGSETKDGLITNFGFLEITRGLVRYENNNINFIKPDNVIGMQYVVQISATDGNGDPELDYAEFRIVGLD